MGFFSPTPTPYDPVAWRTLPLAERGRQVCEAWALDGYGAPLAIYSVYALKAAAYVGAWVFFCSLAPSLGSPSEIGTWWAAPLAFQKAILWSLLFEVMGFGCGSGPLTGRYFPPVGGFLYFLRPGTTKLPLFAKLPLLGGDRRTWLDVLTYAALLGVLVWLLISPEHATGGLIAVAVLVPLLGVMDRTLFLAARAEHYWVTVLCFLFAGNWIAGAKAVQLALWFFAGFSKLNHHFPAVVCVMTSNGPLTRFRWLRERMYQRYPDDLRPSRLAVFLAHLGTTLELGVPLILMLSPGGPSLLLGLVLMIALHTYITSNVPMGVPIEWNVMVAYGGFALFAMHPEVTVLDLGSVSFAVFLVLVLLVLPLLGNAFPHRLSFLLSMRYYAGNWAYSVWLFRGESYRKLRKLTASAGWVHDQLALFYDEPTSHALVGKVMGFRMMHLHGRALPQLVPKAVDDLAEYEWVDGEIIAGLALGWNFGDGHLHNEALLGAIQRQCGFEEGELRCIFVESQPVGRDALSYRIVDAKSGERERGELSVKQLRTCQPWNSSG